MIGESFKVNVQKYNEFDTFKKILIRSGPSILLEAWNRSAAQFYVQNSLK